MVDPTTQALYVLQNEFGFIKIGRSVNVPQRVNALRASDGCEIHVVEVYTTCGDLEEWLHIELDEHRVVGEWFAGTDEARAKLAELLASPDMGWQHPYDWDAAQGWLEKIDEARDKRAIKHLIGKQIGILRGQTVGDKALDWHVLLAWRLAVAGDSPLVVSRPVKGKRNEWQDMWCDRRPDEELAAQKRLKPWWQDYLVLVPPFTTDVSAALTLWPEESRPTQWQGTAIECCIAALVGLRASLPKVSAR